MSQQIAVFRSLGGFTFDATFEEQHSSNLTVTESPVETGVKVSDHAYMEPLRLTISAGVSDTPLLASESDLYKASVARSVRAYELLQGLQRAAEPFTVQTGLKMYENMVIESLTTTQDKDTARVLAFEMTLREVIIVSTQTVAFTPRRQVNTKTKRQAEPKKTGGEQQAEEVPEKKQTILKKLGKIFSS